MQHAATDSVPISTMLTSDVPVPVPVPVPVSSSSSFNPYDQYKVIRRNGSVVNFEPANVPIALANRVVADVSPAAWRFANRRCQQTGVDALYPWASNPFPWRAEMFDLKKEKNFLKPVSLSTVARCPGISGA